MCVGFLCLVRLLCWNRQWYVLDLASLKRLTYLDIGTVSYSGKEQEIELFERSNSDDFGFSRRTVAGFS